MKTGGGIGRRSVEERGNKRQREVEERRREIGGWRRGRIWRREAGDIAQGAPQRALCDVWRRDVGIRNQECGGRKYASGGGTWESRGVM